ncbi:MAG: carbamoyltransferase [Planctomycetia bacterium]|nr:carbamoyltransferase [Planctomycetia bacterium]
MSVILGINAFHAGASAALLVDGQPVIAIPEERLNRVKYYAGFPSMAVRRCLEIAGLKLADIDHVAVGREPSANRGKKIEYVLKNPTKLLKLLKVRAARSQLDDLKTLIAEGCDADPGQLRFRQWNVEHHLAHTASAYFISEWDKAAGFSLDGSGDFVTCMLCDCEGDQITVKHRVYVPHSMGSLYTMICEFIGYGQYGDEGKVMGLAPLGKDTYHERFDEMVILDGDNFQLNSKYFLPFGSDQGLEIDDKGQMVIHRHYSDYMLELFGPPRADKAELTQREMDLAFGLQRVFEKGYMHILNALHRMVPCERVVMSGGCVLNSVANGKLFDQTPFRETCIQPAAGDDGLSLGAALYVSNSMLKEGRRYAMRDAYLGPEFNEAEMKADLDSAGVKYRRLERQPLLEATIDEIVKGNVVGWFQGRMEWGPRALGNRSIVVHPGLPNMKDVLNARIKRREAFRPFAPSVLAERQTDIFEHAHPSPFMLHVYKIKPAWRERLVAVNHVDNTGRLQSVSREENPLYYDLIREFDKRTGIPVLLNTSFNENEPIVCRPSEAIDCFLRTKMDTLAIGPFVCTKGPGAA